MATRGILDFVIIGAGAAGIAAARELSRNGLRGVILEARDRIGGRIFTLRDPLSPTPLELGAEFVHGQPEVTFEILDAGRLPVVEIPEVHWWTARGELHPRHDFWDEIDAIRKRIRPRKRDRSAADFLVAQRSIRGDRRDLFTGFVEGYHAAELERVSEQFLAGGDEETGEEKSNRQYRTIRGYDALIQWVRAGIDPSAVEIRLETVVEAIEWARDNVVVRSRNATGERRDAVRARRAIVTLPVGVLKAGSVRFDPMIPSKERALELLESGHVAKMVLRFRERFWDRAGFVEQRTSSTLDPRLPRTAFFHAANPTMPTWWTAAPLVSPILTGWVGGRDAERMLQLPREKRIARALDALSEVLLFDRREAASLLESVSMHDWSADPFSLGAYSYVLVGGASAQQQLAKPVEGTLFYAGEATDPEQTGTVAGALQSGKRAAAELFKSM